jgi:hypothetical protein
MVRSRIHEDQVVDEGFISEREFNDFHGQVVITGTEGRDDTELTTSFDNYLPGRGIFVGADGNVVTTGTNTINITGFYNEFVASSGTLQGEIDGITGDASGSITVSGVTVTGAVTFDSVSGITIIPDGGTNTLTFSGTETEGSAGITDINSESGPSISLVGAGQVNVSTTASNVITISGADQEFEQVPENAIVGAGEVVVISGANQTIVSGTPHTVNTDTDTISNAIIGGENITVVSGANTTTISSPNTVADAIVGAGEVIVISGSNEIVVSGTPHTINTDDISDAIIGGVGIVVTSGSNETLIDGHLRYTKDENDAIIGGDNVTVVSGADTITISSVDTDTTSDAIIGGENVTVVSGVNTTTISSIDTISDAIIGGTGITVTSGSNETTIDGHLRYQKNENDAILGTDGNTVISGANTITVEGFRPEFVAASGSLQGQIDDNTSDISDNDTDIAALFAKTQVDEINTVTGTVTVDGADGNTVLTQGQTITVSGFRGEFVSASGSLQDQIDAVEGSDVDSVNTLIGDITIVDGYGSNIVTDGGSNSIIVNTFDDDDVDSLTASGVTVTGSVQFKTLGGTTLTTDVSDTDNPIITISGGSEVGELTGSLFQIDFTNGGNTANTWLAVSDSNLGGNTTPWNAAFPCRLAGLSFSNRNDGTDLDMEFHVAREGDGNTSSIEFIWEIRDCRTAYKTDLPLGTIVLMPGDKVSVYANGAGNSGRDVWFGCFWEITSRPSAEGCEDWSGDIT